MILITLCTWVFLRPIMSWRKCRTVFIFRAKRFEAEGPAFCYWNGRVNIFIPEVLDELRRLYTSQTDKDAKYFRRNIHYFNSHFSFTSMGVSIDRSLATAKGTGIYTLKAHGQIYHRLDQLMPMLRDHTTCSYTFMT
jgi:hypothetical protein